jgi:phosphoadenosine phosphosulfate reductase
MKIDTASGIEGAFERHRQIGFQFSGGRDSTAALYLLRAYWTQMTVYHLDTGDQFPETRRVVEAVSRDVEIVTIKTNVAQYRERHGLASDLVPVDNQPVGILISGRAQAIVGRYECCASNLMLPMHARMQEDGITLIVRGQRDDEYATPPLRSGDRRGDMEVLYPIQSWSGDQVSSYLLSNGLPLAEFYERGVSRAPECMGCTAWWDEGRIAYMRRWHPEAHKEFERRIVVIKQEINRQFSILENAQKENQV